MSAELAFQILNTLVMPWWVCWVFAPRSRASAKLASHLGVFAALGALYAGLLLAALSSGPVDTVAATATVSPLDLGFWRGLLSTPLGFLAGWVHYLCFDLFVGAWIVRESQRLAIAPRTALVFTWLTGPLGLALFAGRRWYLLRHSGQLGEVDLA